MLRNDEKRTTRSKSLGYALSVIPSEHSISEKLNGRSHAKQKRINMPDLNENEGSDVEKTSTEENFLPKIQRNSSNNRKASVYFANNPKLIPIISNNENQLSTSLDSTTEALNFHRRSSIKLSKYISYRSDLTRLNRIPLRRFSLNVPISTELERTALPQLIPKRKKSLDSKMPEVPIVKVDESTLKFGTMLSPSAQCALLKTYEDEIHNRMRAYMPQKRLPRITTAKFVSSVKHKRRNILDSKLNQSQQLSTSRSSSSQSFSRASPESQSENKCGSIKNQDVDKNSKTQPNTSRNQAKPKQSIRILKDYRSIEDFNKRIKVADHLQKAMNLITMLEISDAMSIEEIARKYEKWQLTWSKILDECF